MKYTTRFFRLLTVLIIAGLTFAACDSGSSTVTGPEPKTTVQTPNSSKSQAWSPTIDAPSSVRTGTVFSVRAYPDFDLQFDYSWTINGQSAPETGAGLSRQFFAEGCYTFEVTMTDNSTGITKTASETVAVHSSSFPGGEGPQCDIGIGGGFF